MNFVYGIVAGLLALFYLYAGGKKVVQSQQQLEPMMAWAGTAIPMAGVRAIGALEVLGAIGLVLPPLTGIATGLAIAAAACLAVLQVLALGFHLSRHETQAIGLNVILVVWAAATAWLATTL